MSTRTRKTQAALRESLNQESEALQSRLGDEKAALAPQDASGAEAAPAGAEAAPAGATDVAVEAPATEKAPSGRAKKPAATRPAAKPKAKTAEKKAPVAKAPRKVKPAAAAPEAPTDSVPPTTLQEAPAKKKSAAKATPAKSTADSAGKRAKASAETQEPARKDKREKIVRDSFSMPAGEHKQIKALREALGKEGRLVSKSEVLRAALNLIAARNTSEIVSLVDTLPSVPKGKHGKKA